MKTNSEEGLQAKHFCSSGSVESVNGERALIRTYFGQSSLLEDTFFQIATFSLYICPLNRFEVIFSQVLVVKVF